MANLLVVAESLEEASTTDLGQTQSPIEIEEGFKKNAIIRLENLRPNLNPYSTYQNWLEVNRLMETPKARLLKACLDSVALIPLVNNSFLYHSLLNSYSRYISPSQKSSNYKYGHTHYSETKVDEFEQEKDETI